MDIKNICESCKSLNYYAVFTSAIASFIFGMIWYSPFLFGNIWQKEQNLKMEDIKKGMIITYGVSFVLINIMILGLALHMNQMQIEADWKIGAKCGALIGGVFVAPSMGITYLYSKKSLKLWIVDAGYQVGYMIIAGIILSIWK